MRLYINNSANKEYHIQTNNHRHPSITCFPTSMINGAKTAGIVLPDLKSASGYDQEEDQYDWFMHTDPRVLNFAKVNNLMSDPKTDIREYWNLEEFAFNKYVGYDAVKLNFDIKPIEIIDILLNKKGDIVTSGKFCGFGHVVSIPGFIAEVKDVNSPVISDDLSEVTHFVVDDSYGNPNNMYQPLGVGGNNVEEVKTDFLACINKSGVGQPPKYRGIIFLPPQ